MNGRIVWSSNSLSKVIELIRYSRKLLSNGRRIEWSKCIPNARLSVGG